MIRTRVMALNRQKTRKAQAERRASTVTAPATAAAWMQTRTDRRRILLSKLPGILDAITIPPEVQTLTIVCRAHKKKHFFDGWRLQRSWAVVYNKQGPGSKWERPFSIEKIICAGHGGSSRRWQGLNNDPGGSIRLRESGKAGLAGCGLSR